MAEEMGFNGSAKEIEKKSKQVFQNTVGEAKNAYGEAKSAYKDIANELKSEAKEVEQKVSARLGDLKDQAVSAYHTSEKTIRNNPFYAIAGVAAVGILSGYILGARKRH